MDQGFSLLKHFIKFCGWIKAGFWGKGGELFRLWMTFTKLFSRRRGVGRLWQNMNEEEKRNIRINILCLLVTPPMRGGSFSLKGELLKCARIAEEVRERKERIWRNSKYLLLYWEAASHDALARSQSFERTKEEEATKSPHDEQRQRITKRKEQEIRISKSKCFTLLWKPWTPQRPLVHKTLKEQKKGKRKQKASNFGLAWSSSLERDRTRKRQ